MTRSALFTLGLGMISTSAFAGAFTNPITDARFDFKGCAVEGALYGIAHNTYGNVVCEGTLKSDTSKTPVSYFVFYNEKTKAQAFYVVKATSATTGAGDQAGGQNQTKYSVAAVNADLSAAKPAQQATLRIDCSWDYSEGSCLLNGKLASTKVSYPWFALDSIDSELEQNQ